MTIVGPIRVISRSRKRIFESQARRTATTGARRVARVAQWSHLRHRAPHATGRAVETSGRSDVLARTHDTRQLGALAQATTFVLRSVQRDHRRLRTNARHTTLHSLAWVTSNEVEAHRTRRVAARAETRTRPVWALASGALSTRPAARALRGRRAPYAAPHAAPCADRRWGA